MVGRKFFCFAYKIFSFIKFNLMGAVNIVFIIFLKDKVRGSEKILEKETS